MSTGVDSSSNPSEIEALYPFQGFEIVFVVIAVVLWLLWHAVQTISENREYRDALTLYRRVGMDRAMHFSSRAHVATDEDIEAVKAEADGDGKRPAGARPADDRPHRR